MKKKVQFSKVSNLNLVVLFLIIIFIVPILTIIMPRQYISYFENRTLEQFPKFNKENLINGNFFDKLNLYAQDHIAGRNIYIKSYVYLNMNVLNKKRINDIVIGKEDTLLTYFSHEYKYKVDDNKKSLENMVRELKKLNNFIESYGGKFCFVGLPSQLHFYNDRYPYYFNSYKDFLENNERLMFALLKQNDINFINMNDEFKNKYQDYYYKTDHHYNFEGAFKTYQIIINKIKTNFMFNIQKALNEKDMNIITLEKPILGSRNRQLYYLYNINEKIKIAYPKKSIEYKKIDNGKQNNEFYHLNFNNDFFARPSYSVYMGGDLAETIIRTNRNNLPNVLIFGDSFTNALEPLLYYHFNETRILDLRHYNKMSLYEYVKQYKPDIVIMVRDEFQYGVSEGNGNLGMKDN